MMGRDVHDSLSASVRVGPAGIVHRRADGSEVRIAWQELDAVSLEATDQGPFKDDLFWILESATARHVVPGETKGVTDLLRVLRRLPGFDPEALIDATASLEPRTVTCWRRAGSG